MTNEAMKGESLIVKLSPNCIDIDHIAGGHTRITVADVAAGLAYGNLGRGAYLYAMAAYVQDGAVLGELKNYAWMLSATIAKREGWEVVRGKPFLRNASALAVDEHINPQIGYCRRCCGSGQTLSVSRLPIECKRCGGSGNRKLSSGYIAEEIGCGRTHAHNVWRDRYQVIYAELNQWRDAALIHLWRQFADDEAVQKSSLYR